jgi:hypothetical protein
LNRINDSFPIPLKKLMSRSMRHAMACSLKMQAWTTTPPPRV